MLRFGRVALGALALSIVLGVTRQRLPSDRRLWGHLAVAALLLNAAPFTLFAFGQTQVSSILAGIWNATTPLLVLVVVMAALPQERPTRQRMAGLLVGFAGVVVVLGPWKGLEDGALAGHLACLGAATCYGLGFPYTRRFLAGRPESTVTLSTGQLLCATAQMALVTLLVGGAPAPLEAGVVAAMLTLGILGTGVAYILNYAIVRKAGATTASTVTYLIPLFSTVLGVGVLGEALSWHEPVGALVVLGGVAISQGRLSSLVRHRTV